MEAGYMLRLVRRSCGKTPYQSGFKILNFKILKF